MSEKKLKVINLLNPDMCLECRFAKTSTVTFDNGSQSRMIYCTRLDCDNWDTSGFKPVQSVQVDTGWPLEDGN